MGKREEQRRQADRDFEEIRQAIAAQSDEWLIETLREVPHRKWIPIANDEHMAIGIMAHHAAKRLEELTRASLQQTPSHNVAPIAKVTVWAHLPPSVELYAPGLPPGEHDLFPVPLATPGELRNV